MNETNESHWSFSSLAPACWHSDPSDSNSHQFPLRIGSTIITISQMTQIYAAQRWCGKNWQGEGGLVGWRGVRGLGGFRSDISGSPRHRSIVAPPRSIFHCTLHLLSRFGRNQLIQSYAQVISSIWALSTYNMKTFTLHYDKYRVFWHCGPKDKLTTFEWMLKTI